MTAVGVGFSEVSDSQAAGVAAATAALEEAGVSNPDLVLLFHTAKHDPHSFVRGVKSVVGDETRLMRVATPEASSQASTWRTTATSRRSLC